MRVLVVDDNADIRLLFRHILRTSGIEVLEAGDGAQALEVLARPEVIDVVVLDVQMPDIAGWEVLAAIRGDPARAETPVLMCTVKSRPADQARAWEQGCDGYVIKPFHPDDLIDRVRSAAAMSKEDRATARATAYTKVSTTEV